MTNIEIINAKRGKNNPDHMFVKPKYTRDPSKKQLNRVFAENV